VLWAALLGSGGSGADEPALNQVVVTLSDGGRLVGTIVREDDATLILRTTSGLELPLARSTILKVDLASTSAPTPQASPAPGAADLSDPNDTRLLFAPTGRPLGKGDGYLSDHYVIFPGLAYGLTDHVSVSGGVSIVPGLSLNEQVFYVSSTVGWRFKNKTAFSLGGLYATGSEGNDAGALLFGVGSFGSSDRSLSLGLGLAATRNEEYYYDENDNYLRTEHQWTPRDAPIVMLGGTFRVGKRLSLVTESWLLLGKDFRLSEQPFGLAVRFFGERLSVDLGVVLVADVIEEGFPIPWLSFSYHFGPSHGAAPRGHASLPRLAGGRARYR
jgi:hypothetical protein